MAEPEQNPAYRPAAGVTGMQETASLLLFTEGDAAQSTSI